MDGWRASLFTCLVPLASRPLATLLRARLYTGVADVTDFIFEFAFRVFWPSALAVLVVAGASVTVWARRPRRMATLSLVITVAVLAWYVGMLHGHAAESASNVLARDIVGELLIGAAAPLLAAGAAGAVPSRTARVWAGVAAALVGIAWVLASPVLLLVIHCTSGDCL